MPYTVAGLPPDFIPPDVACFGKRYVKKWQATIKNLRTYDYWRQLFWTAAISRFDWEGLPNGIDPRYLEVLLCGWGNVAATKRVDSPVAPFWVGRCTPLSRRDIYNNPNEIDIIGYNGFRQRRHANYWIKRRGNQYKKSARVMPPDAVLCWDNLTRFPTLQLIDLQAERLANMDSVIDQHVNAQRVPWIFAVDEVGKKNAETFFNQVQSGQPAIYQYPTAMQNVPYEVLETGASYHATEMLNDELKIVSQVYTLLGIDNNAAAEKRERVQTAETEANNEQFLIQRNSYLKPRQDFAKACNEVLGWDCSVKWAVRHPKDLERDALRGEEPGWDEGKGLTFEFGAGGGDSNGAGLDL